jgi:glycosyltransferase involved in cell wall biosynthesis
LVKYFFISHSGHLHGAEICLLETITALKTNSDCEVHVLIGDRAVDLQNELQKIGVIVHTHIPNYWWVGQKKSFKEKLWIIKQSLIIRKKFGKLLEVVKPDYVITNSVVSNPIFNLVARLKKIKSVWYIHELGDTDHQYIFYLGRSFTFFVIKCFSDKMLFNSQFTVNHFTKSHSSKFSIIDYAVTYTVNENAVADRIDKSNWELIIAGRTVEGKGQIDAVHAISILKKKYNINNVHLTLLGSIQSDYTNLLQKICIEEKLEGNVTFVPFSNNVSHYFSKADIGITTSRNEAFGRITVEYMKYGLITIGAAAGATQEIIADNQNGFLYQVADAENLAVVLYKVLNGSVETTSLTESAKKKAFEQYNLNRHFEAFTAAIA